MKFTINRSDIRNVLSKVQGVTGRKTNLAITETVLIGTADDGIRLIATDLETGLEGFYPANVEAGGTIAINAKKFYEVVRDFPSDEVIVSETESRWIEIGNQSIEYHLVGMDPEDFPDTPRIEDVEFFEIESAGLRRMIEKTVIISGAPDDNRAHINGILFERIAEQDEKLVRMVSTDGSRLSTADVVYDNDAELQPGPGIIIPKKGLYEVIRFLDGDGTVMVGAKDNHFVVRKDAETIVIRLLEGDFPRYNDIVVKGDNSVVRTDRKMFLRMLKRMSILTSDTYKGVVFNFEKDKLRITATNPDMGEAKEEMGISYDGDSVEAAFNPKYFIECLNVIDDDNAVLNIVDEKRPCLIEGEADKSYLSVVMPMRI